MRGRGPLTCFISLAVGQSLAVAQVPLPPTGGNSPPPIAGPSGLSEPGIWRVSDLIGQDVVTPDGRDVGEVRDLVFSPRGGALEAVVLSLGGFLGIGERRVAVPLASIQIVPAGANVASGTVGGLPPSTPEGARVREEMLLSRVLTPEKIVITVPPEQLASAPTFQGNR